VLQLGSSHSELAWPRKQILYGLYLLFFDMRMHAISRGKREGRMGGGGVSGRKALA
jgi:hypothetical protein